MSRKSRIAVVLATACALLALPIGAYALGPSDIDTSFGSGGVASTGVTGLQYGAKLAVQPDGKIVVAIGLGTPPVLTRLTADGAPDTSFGNGGKVILDSLGASQFGIVRTLVAPSGTIYVVGWAQNGSERGAIWAIKPDGNPQTGFNGTGSKLFPPAGSANSPFTDAALTPGGRIATIGWSYSGSLNSISLIVSDASGAVTNSSTTSVPGRSIDPMSLTATPDGRIILAARSTDPTSGYQTVELYGFDSTATLDLSFGENSNGKETYGLFGDSIASRLASNGTHIAAIGSVGGVAALGLYTSAGTLALAPPYGFNRAIPFGALYSTATDGGFVDGGKIFGFGSGFTGPGVSGQFTLAERFNADGQFDGSFAPGGMAKVALNGVYPASFGLQPGGKYILAYGVQGTDEVRLTRLWGDAPIPLSTPATAAFAKSVKSKSKAAKFKAIRGTAAGTGVSKVELAIQKVDTKLLKKSKRCAYFKSTKLRVKKVKAVRGKCVPNVWIKATGTTSWSVKLKRTLKPGKYVLSARATGSAGVGAVKSKKITLTK